MRINRLNDIIQADDLNTHLFSAEYDFILSTVEFMFLGRPEIPAIIRNMQDSPRIGGTTRMVREGVGPGEHSTDPCP